jgi:hypothetical protein
MKLPCLVIFGFLSLVVATAPATAEDDESHADAVGGDGQTASGAGPILFVQASSTADASAKNPSTRFLGAWDGQCVQSRKASFVHLVLEARGETVRGAMRNTGGDPSAVGGGGRALIFQNGRIDGETLAIEYHSGNRRTNMRRNGEGLAFPYETITGKLMECTFSRAAITDPSAGAGDSK